MDQALGKWVALLRGVNVGGANRVPMEELRHVAGDLGWQNVRSYIASGNLVFDANEACAQDLRDAIARHIGVDVPVLVLPASAVITALTACRWEAKGNLVHVLFCWEVPQVDVDLRDTLMASDEELAIDGTCVWLYAPSGVARSKLMAKMDRVLGVQTTARNLNTLRKLAEMVR